MGAALGLAGRGKYSVEAKGAKSKQDNSGKGRKGRRMGRAESKAEMKCKQKPPARANKFRAVN